MQEESKDKNWIVEVIVYEKDQSGYSLISNAITDVINFTFDKVNKFSNLLN